MTIHMTKFLLYKIFGLFTDTEAQKNCLHDHNDLNLSNSRIIL